jgi:hypothetical protein
VNEKGDSVASFSPAVRRGVALPERPQVDEEYVLAQINRIMAGDNDPFLVWKRLRWIAGEHRRMAALFDKAAAAIAEAVGELIDQDVDQDVLLRGRRGPP